MPKRTFLTELACAALLVSLVVGCGSDDDATGVAREPGGRQAISASELAADPRSHFGTKVIVRGPAVDVYNALLFSLDEDPARPGPDVLVVIPRPASIALPGETLTVEGTVQPYDREELESDFGFELAPEVDALVRARPVVVAESVRTADGADVVAETE